MPRDPVRRLGEIERLVTLAVMSAAATALVEKFVAELTKVIREELIQSLLAGENLSPGRTTMRIPAPPGKRTAETLASQANAALIYIKRHPGSSAVEIAKGLNMDVKELVLPIQKLKADKAVKVSGVRRGTKYTAR